ncbi:MAG: universal stress protein [Ilumatobacter sp.]
MAGSTATSNATSTATSMALWTIGHDGSDNASHAAMWALAQAAGRSVDVSIVRGRGIPALELPLPSGSEPTVANVANVGEVAEGAEVRVCDDFDELLAAARAGGVSLAERVVGGPATLTLLEESEKGALLVVGSRGLGGFKRLLLGSVSTQCATHSRVATVVVPRSAAVGRAQRIVVGVDGSQGSQRALRWALDFAPKGSDIMVVGAWMPSKSGFIAVVQHYTNELDQARAHFNEVLDAVEADVGSQQFERRFDYGDPASALLEASAEADLVVVGQRGHSALGAAILGSVSTHVLHRSAIAVAVIPDLD